jgi:hypothetical protein
MRSQHHARAAVEAERLPPGLRSAAARGELRDGVRAEVGDRRDGLTRRGVLYGYLRAGGRAAVAGVLELLNEVRVLDGRHQSVSPLYRDG